MHLPLKEVFIAKQGAVQHYTGDDGYPAAAVRDMIVAESQDGRHFYLSPFRPMTAAEREEDDGSAAGPMTVYWSHDAVELVEKIKARGTLRPEYWVEFVPDTRSLEERWAEDAEIEAQERAGLRTESW